MSSSSPNNYVIIFDTNILYEKAENGCDFCEFKFNRLFQNIVDEIEERDLVEHITIAGSSTLAVKYPNSLSINFQ